MDCKDRLLPVALLLAFGCATTPRADRTLRVLVLNMHAGHDGAGADNLAGVGALIRSTAADVVLLQEVDRRTRRSRGVDQPAVLEKRTGLRGVFGRTLDYDGGEYGIATLSRWRIGSKQMVPLPVAPPQSRAGGSKEPRGALVISGPSAVGPLQVINTHLDASREEVFRLQEAERLLAVIASRPAGGWSVVVGGDFNSTPESEVQQRLRGSGLRDAWSECGSGDGFTYPAIAPTKRIDYLFLAGPLRCTSATVFESTVSDHRPVLVVVVSG